MADAGSTDIEKLENAIRGSKQMKDMLLEQKTLLGHNMDKQAIWLSTAALGFMFSQLNHHICTFGSFLYIASAIALAGTILLTVWNFSLAIDSYETSYRRFAKNENAGYRLLWEMKNSKSPHLEDRVSAGERIPEFLEQYNQTVREGLENTGTGIQRFHEWIVLFRNGLFVAGIGMLTMHAIFIKLSV